MRPGGPPMVRGPPRGMVRGRYPAPMHMGPDGSPIRAPGISPSKGYYPAGGSRFMSPGMAWDDPMAGRARPFEYDHIFSCNIVHQLH